jgi:hypothetical protein
MDGPRAGTPARERPFFVVGCPRSGTTLLRVILDGHSRLSIPPESHFIVGLSARRHARAAGVDDVFAHPLWQEWPIDESQIRRGVELRDPDGYPELVSAVFETFAESRGKARWGDKTPGYVSHIDRLARLFPDGQFIHVIRDGREVAASLREQEWGPRRAAVGAFWWRRKVAAGLRSGRRLPDSRYTEVRLERLVADPEGTVRRLCAFLGEAFEPAMLDRRERAAAMFAPGHAVTRHVGEPLAAGLRDWRAGLAGREQLAIEALCHRQLAVLGYPDSRWSAAGAACGWTAVGVHAVRNLPAAVRARLRPGRRRY